MQCQLKREAMWAATSPVRVVETSKPNRNVSWRSDMQILGFQVCPDSSFLFFILHFWNKNVYPVVFLPLCIGNK
jgi:hypothetical protein